MSLLYEQMLFHDMQDVITGCHYMMSLQDVQDVITRWAGCYYRMDRTSSQDGQDVITGWTGYHYRMEWMTGRHCRISGCHYRISGCHYRMCKMSLQDV